MQNKTTKASEILVKISWVSVAVGAALKCLSWPRAAERSENLILYVMLVEENIIPYYIRSCVSETNKYG
jgi:hypothetical protein